MYLAPESCFLESGRLLRRAMRSRRHCRTGRGAKLLLLGVAAAAAVPAVSAASCAKHPRCIPPPIEAALEALPAIRRLQRLGYLNCSFKYDELKDSCATG